MAAAEGAAGRLTMVLAQARRVVDGAPVFGGWWEGMDQVAQARVAGARLGRSHAPASAHGHVRSRVTVAVRALVVACVVGSALPAHAVAEQASEPGFAAAGGLDAGVFHTCALLTGGSVRCWGASPDGQLGYGNQNTVGDDETPGSVGPVDLGAGHTATAIAAGDFHTCALLEDGTVRCWGFGNAGRLGYGNTDNIGDNETPSSVGRVKLGSGRTATAITAGGAHTCALLDDGNVRCWGYNANGQLGYGNTSNVGDATASTPDKVGPVDLGLGRKAVAISAGSRHTCAVLDNGSVRCWGHNSYGQLGNGTKNQSPEHGIETDVGDNELPGSVAPVDLGPGQKAVAVSAGGIHTCALLDDATVRCWGYGANGELGYGNRNTIVTPGMVGPVDVGPGRSVLAINAGAGDTCARLDDASVRCWGNFENGRLGYGNTGNIGDDETPGSVGPVDLGSGRSALAVSLGQDHTCARLDDASVRCWGLGANGRLGYCNENSIGDDESPGSVGPVSLEPGSGASCPSPAGILAAAPSTGAAQSTGAKQPPPASSDAVRARGLRSCLASSARHAKREQSLSRRGSARQRAKARRHLRRHSRDGRRRCLRLFGRTPGRITGLRASARGSTQIKLTFNAAGTDGKNPPPARSYLVTQSLHPLGSALDFARAQRLCKAACRFAAGHVGGKLSLAVTNLRPHTTYYYAIAARDNVSARRGPRSQAVRAKTR